MSIEDLLTAGPYSLSKTEKEKLYGSFLSSLTAYHYGHCEPYRKILDSIGFDVRQKHPHTDIPFLPVQLFKTTELRSTTLEIPVKKLSSSGTSGQNKSNIYLDKENAVHQTKVLAKIAASFIGKKRLPMLIIEAENNIENKTHLSAHSAGVIGFSMLGSQRHFALNQDMELDINRFQDFLRLHQGERIFIFGFTFMLFKHFYLALIKLGIKPDLSNAVLIHGGGWKKLEKEAVSPADFRIKLKNVCGITSIYDYYGMAEQTGSIFMECESGHYHASVFSDIIIRRDIDFSIAGIGEEGIIQVISLLPKSYPGHSLLTDDKGVLLGEDNCPCKRLGKYFKLTGRVFNRELKGCSDSYE
ncbi:MAG: acyl-protein synthetase [Bacteroidia bacterium]